jgi:hypothetical protein
MEDHMASERDERYYSPLRGELPGWETEICYARILCDATENGYPQLFLNGGIIYDVLFILVLLPAVVLAYLN